MSPRYESAFLPCEERPLNLVLSFDQNQWRNDQALYLSNTNELNPTVNSSAPTNSVDGLSLRSEEETPTSEASISDSEDTVSNSQLNVELTWDQLRSASTPVMSPRGFPYVEQDRVCQQPALPLPFCDASFQPPRSHRVNLSSSCNSDLSKAYNAALQAEPRIQITLNHLAPLVRSTAPKERVSGNSGTPRTRTRIPNSVKDIILYLHDAYFSVYPDATVKDIAGQIAYYLAKWS